MPAREGGSYLVKDGKAVLVQRTEPAKEVVDKPEIIPEPVVVAPKENAAKFPNKGDTK